MKSFSTVTFSLRQARIPALPHSGTQEALQCKWTPHRQCLQGSSCSKKPDRCGRGQEGPLCVGLSQPQVETMDKAQTKPWLGSAAGPTRMELKTKWTFSSYVQLIMPCFYKHTKRRHVFFKDTYSRLTHEPREARVVWKTSEWERVTMKLKL